MFTHQLVAEILPSIAERASVQSLNEPDAVRRLLERHTGFGQFRVVLSGTVNWAPGTLGLPEHNPLVDATTLKDVILAYAPEDRSRVVDAIDLAIRERHGFHFNARMTVGGSVRVIETIGDCDHRRERRGHGTVRADAGRQRQGRERSHGDQPGAADPASG